MFYPLRTAILPDGGDDDHPRALTAAQFQGLADFPPELEWFTNLQNSRTREAYQLDLQDFRRVTEMEHAEAFRRITRAPLIAWRDNFTQRDSL